MTQYKRRNIATQKPATTNDRNYRTFLLVTQLEAQAIGARIALARNEQGMTQEEMCELASFSKRSLSDYENGVTIPYKHLREISALLGRPVEFFLHGEPEAEPSVTERPPLDEVVWSELHEIRRLLEDLTDRLPPKSARG